jgi:hypothetical protein
VPTDDSGRGPKSAIALRVDAGVAGSLRVNERWSVNGELGISSGYPSSTASPTGYLRAAIGVGFVP